MSDNQPPERVVHAKGGGAHRFFELTEDVTPYCTAGARIPTFFDRRR